MTMEQIDHLLPIDRGWAWVITLASTGFFTFVAGGYKTQGIILVELQELYPNHSAKALLWIFSTSFLLTTFGGPFNGLLLVKTSNRFVSLIGAVLLVVSHVTFAYSNQLIYMYISYGLTYGLGAGMVKLSAYTAYNEYFNKKKALSIGLATSGSGIGTIAIPPLLRWLFDNFSFSGAILLYGGLAMQLLVLATLLRPMSYYEELAARKLNRASSDDDETGIIAKEKEAQLTLEVDDSVRQRSISVGAKNELSLPAAQSRHTFLSAPHGINRLHPYQSRSKRSLNVSIKELSSMNDMSGGPSGLLFACNLQPDSSDSNESTTCTSNTELSSEESAQTPRFNWRIFINPWSLLLGFAIMVYSCGMAVTYQTIPSLGKSSGVSKTLMAILLTIAGCIEIPGRIVNGLIADKGYFSSLTQLGLCMGVTSICALVCASVSGTAGILTMIVGLSSVGTAVYTLIPIASGELLGKQNVPSMMSINFLYEGLGCVIATFCAGEIYDTFLAWEAVFFYICVCFMCGSLIMFATSFAFYVVNKRKSNQASAENSLASEK